MPRDLDPRVGRRLVPGDGVRRRDGIVHVSVRSDYKVVVSDSPHEREQTFELFFPQAIERYFPRETLEDNLGNESGLVSLRQVARPE